MRNSKIKVKPFASGVSSPGSGYDVNAGASVSTGRLTTSVSASKGSGYPTQFNIEATMYVPITKKVKMKNKL
jgi:hypothetical protein